MTIQQMFLELRLIHPNLKAIEYDGERLVLVMSAIAVWDKKLTRSQFATKSRTSELMLQIEQSIEADNNT